MLIRRMLSSAVLMGVIVVSGTCFAEEPEKKKIEDNSFLIEEAYNQESGVIQHIQTFQYMIKDKNWGFTFTQEWPVPGQTHQLSYTIPVTRLADSEKVTGIGDVALNYRYQAIMKERVALAPRFSLILPTGDNKKGLGNDALGFQTNIPLSVELNDSFVTHWNAGLTFTPGSKHAEGAKADILGLNAGASIIWLATETFNLMLEGAWNSSRTFREDGTTTRENSFFINPGMRYAINFKSGLQIVPGLAFPVGVGPSKGDYGVFAYLSFEHPLF